MDPLCLIPFNLFLVKILKQFIPTVLLVTIMLTVTIYTAIWESCVDKMEDEQE